MVLPQYPNAIAKSSVSVVISLRYGDSVYLCSMDFVSDSNIEIVYSRNIFSGHCMRQVARSTCRSSLSLFRYIWGLIKHYTTVWWPTSRFMVAGTSYMHHTQLFSKKNLWNETSQKVAKEKFWSQLLLKRAKFLLFGSKRANLATLPKQ